MPPTHVPSQMPRANLGPNHQLWPMGHQLCRVRFTCFVRACARAATKFLINFPSADLGQTARPLASNMTSMETAPGAHMRARARARTMTFCPLEREYNRWKSPRSKCESALTSQCRFFRKSDASRCFFFAETSQSVHRHACALRKAHVIRESQCKFLPKGSTACVHPDPPESVHLHICSLWKAHAICTRQ